MDYEDLTLKAKLTRAQSLADSLAGQLTVLGGEAFETALALSELISIIDDDDDVWNGEY